MKNQSTSGTCTAKVIASTKTESLLIKGKKFLEKIIRMRRHIERIGKSLRPEQEENCRVLEFHKNDCTSSERMARLLLCNTAKIRMIIPNNSAGVGLCKQYEQLINEAKKLTA